jgi:hypothetical protein
MELDEIELALIPMLVASYFNHDPAVGNDSQIDDRILALCTKATDEIKKRINETKT